MPSASIPARKRCALALGCAVALTACGDESKLPAASTSVTPSPAATMIPVRQADAGRAARALRAARTLLPGSIGPENIANVECKAAEGANDYDCSFILDSMEPSWFRVRLEAGGALTKLLADRDPVEGTKTDANVAALLAADDKLQGAPSRTRSWSCRRSPRLEPDGTATPSGAGYLCTSFWRVSRIDARRYVEFASDGTALRDYVLRP